MDAIAAALDGVFGRWARSTRAPGVAWGLIRDGELRTSGGLGTLRIGEDATPDAHSVFRIASMTKSFTGAALMRLVVEGTVGLDEPVTTYVPELAGWRGPTADAPTPTVRHLVSMESGLPTDDPWADRHMDVSTADMDALLDAGATFAWAPGVRFEYSNLGWGLVGRIVERVGGVRVQDAVTTGLLGPLGLSATTWTRPEDAGAVAEPYRWEDETWRHEGEPIGDGAIAPMGGLWSTVSDLARWVGFFLDAWPPRDDPDDGPLPRWARREMQQLRRTDAIGPSRPRPGGPARTIASGYGIGLFVRLDPRLGEVVAHSGGLPGYGSHMRWIPDRGVGIVALSNVTYGAMGMACAEALDVLEDLGELGPARTASTPLLSEAAARSAVLLSDWSHEEADSLFADTVAMDEAVERRAKEAGELVGRHGPVSVESLQPDTPMRGTFTAAGGLVKVELGLNHAGEVQWLDVTDRSRPSDAPIVVDAEHLRAVRGKAFVVLRPVADLADAFARWQGECLDRLGEADAVVPAAHATVKAFGSQTAHVRPEDERAIADVVAAWAAATPPVVLRAEALDVFDDEEHVPILRLESLPALRDLWSRSSAPGLPPAEEDAISADGWVAHLSLAYPREVDPARWAEVTAWARGVATGGVSCVVLDAELVVFDGGLERRVGRYRFGG